MKTGFVFVEIHDGRPGLARIGCSETSPVTDAPGERHIRYAARFHDSEAAMMHVHELLKRRLVDADAHLYRVEPRQAIAAMMSLGLRHTDHYLDPHMAPAEVAGIRALVEQLQARRRRIDRLFTLAGYAGIALLLFNLVVLSLP